MFFRKKRKNRVVSLRFKIVAGIVLAELVLSAVAIAVGYEAYSSDMNDHYIALSSGLANTAASQLDADEILHYYEEIKKAGEFDAEKYENDEGYRADFDAKADAIKDEDYYKMLGVLRDIKENNGLSYIYVQKLEGDKCVYILDADEDGAQLGFTEEVSDATKQAANPENGIPAFITNSSYGWLCTSMEPVKDEGGNPVALVGVDISMDAIMHERFAYLINVILLIGVATLLLIVVTFFVVEFALVRPIDALSEATSSFVRDREAEQQTESAISRLNIKTGDEVETLCDSVKQMERDINNYIAYQPEITAEKERLSAELNVAAQIQADMLPRIFPPFPDRVEFDIYATMDPAKEVGGDFYDFFLVDENRLALVMADVSGKGVPASLFMVIAKTLIKNHAQAGETPSEILKNVNEQLLEGNEADLFVTVWLALIDLTTGKGIAVNAGNEHPALRRAGGEYELIKYRHSPAVASMDGLTFREHEFDLGPGDSLFVYTDGVAEATDSGQGLFGTDRMLAALNRNPNAHPRELLKNVRGDIDAFVGEADQFDDITMLCFEYYGKAGKGGAEEITLDATVENTAEAISFIDGRLEKLGFDEKAKMQTDIALEELFVNIAHYAYGDKTGKAVVRFEYKQNPDRAIITLIDSGTPYNPLEKKDPDTTLSAEERPIGGLGVFMAKNFTDGIKYEYKDGKNILTIEKNVK